LSLDLDSLFTELEAPTSRVIFLASPNNPTGNCFPAEQIEEILRRTDRLVVVDEAYRLFCGGSLRNRLEAYPNLAILNTFSKAMSLAGLRIGYLVAHPEVIQTVNRVRLPYNLDAAAQYVARRVLERPELWTAQAEQVKSERDRVALALALLPGMTVYPSCANFLFVRTSAALRLRTELSAAGIAVRGFAAAEGVGDCLRVTIGRPDENDRFLHTCQDLLQTGRG
jgi:histidinol-phosphate aminotransferase